MFAPSTVRDWNIEIPGDETPPEEGTDVERALDEHIETRKQFAKLRLIAKRSPIVIAEDGFLREAWVSVCDRLGQSYDIVLPVAETKREQPKLPDSLPAGFPPKLLVGPDSLFTQCHYRLMAGQHPASKDSTEVERFRYFVYCIGQADVMTRAEQQGFDYDWEENLCPNFESRRIDLARLFRFFVQSDVSWLPVGSPGEQTERWAEYNWARSGQQKHTFWYPSLIVEVSNHSLSRALMAAGNSEVA